MIKKFKFILTQKENYNLVFLFFGSIILSISEVFGIGIIIPIMNLCLKPSMIETSSRIKWFYQASGAKDGTSFLVILIVSAIILFIFKCLYSIYIAYQQQRFVGRVYNRLTSKLLSSYLNKPYSFHLESNSSVLFKNISAEVGQFTTGFLTPVIFVSSEMLITVAILLLLIFIYPIITIILLAVFSCIILIMNFFFKKRIRSYADIRKKYSEQTYKSALESLQAIKEIKVYNVINFFVERFSHAVEKYTNGFVKFNVVNRLPRYILESLLFGSILSILLFGTIYGKSFTQLIPMMVVMGAASLRLLPSINKIYTNMNMLLFSLNSLNIICDVFKEKQDPNVSLNTMAEHKNDVITPDAILLKQVTFCYKGTPRPIFDDLNLTIPLRSTVAVVGETGVGKSTLIDILTGLLIPSQGRFYYAGTLITKRNLNEYSQKVGYVPQQIFLMDDTLEANIAFGVPGDKINTGQLKQVIQLAYLGRFVSSLPNGVKTQIGERGVRLSGGQRQRIGIARALYRNPEILILDEATSSLDGYTESEISKAIQQLSGKLTVIIIAHRFSTIKHADIIYLMESGKIVAQGTFEELLEHSSIFRKITDQKAYFHK